MPPRPAHPLAALLLEHANLGPVRFALDDGNDPRTGDKRRAGEDLASVFFNEQHLIENDLCAWFAGGPIEQGESAGRHPHLPPARLDDCVHIRHLCKTSMLARKWLTCKEIAPSSLRMQGPESRSLPLPLPRAPALARQGGKRGREEWRRWPVGPLSRALPRSRGGFVLRPGATRSRVRGWWKPLKPATPARGGPRLPPGRGRYRKGPGRGGRSNQ